MEHVITLFFEGCVAEAICLSPCALVMTVLLSDVIARPSRVFMLELSLSLLAERS
jgi:hypothetical protein